jgi:hypothetical protein
MHLGGRVADIVSMIPTQATGEWSFKGWWRTPRSTESPKRTVGERGCRSSWSEASGRGAAHHGFRTVVGDDGGAALAKESADTDVPGSAMEDSTLFLTGTGSEVRDRLRHWQDRAGITCVSLFDPGEGQIEYLAEEAVAPLVES